MKVVPLSTSLHGSFLGRVVRSPSLVRHDKHHHEAILDEIDDPATVMTTRVLTPKQPWKVQPSGKCQRAVHFEEQFNQVYENDLVLTSQDCLNLWYTSSELGQFKSKVRQDVTALLVEEKLSENNGDDDNTSWAKVLTKVYQSFCRNEEDASSSNSELDATVALLTMGCGHKQPLFVDRIDAIGIASRAVRAVDADLKARHKTIHDLVLHYQHVNDPNVDALLARACQGFSRPARLFAQFVAQLSASSEL